MDAGSVARAVVRVLVVMVALTGVGVGASAPATAALVASGPLPRTSLARGSAVEPLFRPQADAGDTAGSGSARRGEETVPQGQGEPVTSHWAVLIGVDGYQAPTTDTIGSVADTGVLAKVLARRGWREDHIRTLTSQQATGANIRQTLQWLATRADEDSTVVVSFSGHIDTRDTSNGPVAGLWTHDNERLWRGELARLLGAVDADRMWVSLQGCHAAGLAAPGVEGDDRVVTYSSRADEYSYEDPLVGHSVMGNYLFREALAQGRGNQGSPHGVSVQDAFGWAAPRAHRRTGGRQTPLISDQLDTPFTLAVAQPRQR